MINYSDKPGIEAALQAAGFTIIESTDGFHAIHDGSESADTDAAAQAIIDGYTLAEAIAPQILQVKALARAKILAFLPDWQQSNFNARMNELNEARFTRALTDAEQADVEAMRTAWDRAKAVRAASNVHEANLAALDSFGAVSGYDITAGWPEP